MGNYSFYKLVVVEDLVGRSAGCVGDAIANNIFFRLWYLLLRLYLATSSFFFFLRLDFNSCGQNINNARDCSLEPLHTPHTTLYTNLEDVVFALDVLVPINYSEDFRPRGDEVCDVCRFMRREMQERKGRYRLFLLVDIEGELRENQPHKSQADLVRGCDCINSIRIGRVVNRFGEVSRCEPTSLAQLQLMSIEKHLLWMHARKNDMTLSHLSIHDRRFALP